MGTNILPWWLLRIVNTLIFSENFPNFQNFYKLCPYLELAWKMHQNESKQVPVWSSGSWGSFTNQIFSFHWTTWMSSIVDNFIFQKIYKNVRIDKNSVHIWNQRGKICIKMSTNIAYDNLQTSHFLSNWNMQLH